MTKAEAKKRGGAELAKKKAQLCRLRQELRRLETRERNMARWRHAFTRTGEMLSGAVKLRAMLRGMVKNICRLSGLERVGIFSYDTHTQMMHRLAGTDDKGRVVTSVASFPFDKSAAGTGLHEAIHSRHGYFYTDHLQSDTRVADLKHRTDRQRCATCFAVAALRSRGRLIGAIGADNALSLRPFKRGAFERLSPFFEQVAVILENHHIYKDLQRKAGTFAGLLEVNRTLISMRREGGLLQRVFHKAVELLKAEGGAIFMPDKRTKTLYIRWHDGHQPGMKVDKVRVALGQGVIGTVASKGEPIIVNDAPSDPRFLIEIAQRAKVKIRCFAAAPLAFRDKSTGVIMILNKQIAGRFSRDDLECLTILASQVAVTIDTLQLYHDLRRLYFEAVLALVRTIEIKAPHLRGHSETVTRYSQMIGETLKMKGEDMEALTFAALLHDVGKVGVPDRVLKKKDHALTQIERVLMESHPTMGVGILREIKGAMNILPGVEHHHENWDGNGYPHGLAKKKIPLAARVIRMANDIVFYTSRAYGGKPYSPARVARMLRQQSSAKYDPGLVRITTRLLKKAKPRRGPLDYYLDAAKAPTGPATRR